MGDQVEVSTELLDWLKNAAEQGEAFVQREAPLFVEETLAWVFWSNVLYAIGATAAAAVVLLIGRTFYNRIKKEKWEYGPEPETLVPCILACLAGVMLLASSGSMIANA